MMLTHILQKTDGIFGFLPGEDAPAEQKTPVLLPNLKNITDIASGANHAMAIDNKGVVYAWGCGEQNQLGYHIVQRTSTNKKNTLNPSPLRTRLKTYKAIYIGNDHSFAVDTKDRVWGWGSNSFGGTGIPDGAGDDNAAVYTPQIVKTLNFQNDTVTHIAGGQHHSIAVTANGKALVWGRVDGQQVGLDLSTVPDSSTIQDDAGKVRIVIKPTAIPNIGNAIWASAGTDHSIVINNQGHAYSWGFSANYQTGQGTTMDIKHPTHIDNTAVRGKKLNWSGCGGQYSILAAPAQNNVVVNGVNGN